MVSKATARVNAPEGETAPQANQFAQFEIVNLFDLPLNGVCQRKQLSRGNISKGKHFRTGNSTEGTTAQKGKQHIRGISTEGETV